MQIPRVLPVDPRRQGALQLQWTRLLTKPAECFFQRPQESLRVGVPFRVVVTGDRLRDLERRTGLHEGA